jgi:molybdopterin converting factor small subunit
MRIQVKVRFYGKLAEQIAREIDLDCAGRTVGDVRARLSKAYPDSAQDLQSHLVRACVGDEMVDDSFPLDSVEAVELFAPVSGG